MASYKVVIEARAIKEIKKIPTPQRKKIALAIDKLGRNPLPANSRKLIGSTGYRLRVGDYRIIYEVEHKVITVFIVRVGHRKNIYKKL